MSYWVGKHICHLNLGKSPARVIFESTLKPTWFGNISGYVSWNSSSGGHPFNSGQLSFLFEIIGKKTQSEQSNCRIPGLGCTSQNPNNCMSQWNVVSVHYFKVRLFQDLAHMKHLLILDASLLSLHLQQILKLLDLLMQLYLQRLMFQGWDNVPKPCLVAFHTFTPLTGSILK